VPEDKLKFVIKAASSHAPPIVVEKHYAFELALVVLVILLVVKLIW
jgi:hypothetical protein